MRRALLVLAAISFSQLAAAQTTPGRADSGASTEPQNPADASVSKDVPQVEPRERALKEENAGTGVTATPLPPRDESVSKDVVPPAEPRDRALPENPPSPGAGATATPLPSDK